MPRLHIRHFPLAGLRLAVCLTFITAGCVSEQSVPLHGSDALRLPRDSAARTTRQWLESTHLQLKPLLPAGCVAPLRTDQMSDAAGAPRNVWSYFHLEPTTLRSALGNFSGLLCTAKAASRDFHVDVEPPPWPGFDTVWIPVEPDLSLCARWGLTRDGDKVRDATTLILLPAMFGDNGVLRTRDMAIALRQAGYHVLSLELRGYGQTEKRYPDCYSTFGILEIMDTLAVSDWLQRQPHVRRIGLLGFCWGANTALLAAWFDHRRPDDPNISPAIAAHCRAPATRSHFAAGIMAVSPILRWEDLVDELDKPHTAIADPVMAGVQDTIRTRMIRKHFPSPDGSMRRLIDIEYAHCGHTIPGGAPEGYPFLRLMPYHGRQPGDKLDAARVPVLVVHGANDPLAPSQDVADFLASIHNPLVAGVILPGGGHVGFASFCKQYYLSLIVNFFDPDHGPAANPPSPLANGEPKWTSSPRPTPSPRLTQAVLTRSSVRRAD